MTRRALAALLAASLAPPIALGVALRPPHAPVPEAGAFALRDVSVVEPGRARLRRRTLRVAGGRIAAIEPRQPAASGPAAPDTADLAGGTVLPGLIDLHVHHPPGLAWGERELFGLLFLAHGVTAVRDTGSLVGDLRGHVAGIASGRAAGPRTFACGPFLDGEPPVWPTARVVRRPEEAEAAIAEHVAAGYDCGKLYNHLTPAVVAALREAAARHGLPLVAHVPRGLPLIELGDTEVQHLMGTHDAWDDVTPAHLERVVAVSRARGIAHTPTLVVFERALQLDRYAAALRDPALRWLPRHYRDWLWSPERNPRVFDLLPGDFAGLRERVVHMRRLVGMLHEAGVPIGAGSDAPNPFVVPGHSLHEELALLVEAGLSPEEAWLAATRRAGRMLGEPRLGTLEPGAPADLLVFRKDPTRDLAALATLEAVVAGGRLYRKSDLDAALARARAHFAGQPYDAVSTAAARMVLAWLNR